MHHVFLKLSYIVHVLVVEEVLLFVLFVVIIRRFVLVDIELLHLLPGLFLLQISLSLSQNLLLNFMLSLFLLLALLLLFFLLLINILIILALLESLEDVLLVKKCMTKLVLEVLVV